MKNIVLALLWITLAGSVPAAAQGFWIGGTYGFGGDLQNDVGVKGDNENLNVFFAYETSPDLDLRFALGSLELHSGAGNADQFPIEDARLAFGTVSVSYRFVESYYESGIAIGLGAYHEQREFYPGAGHGDFAEDESAFGVNFGLNGRWRAMRRLSVVLDVTAHYVTFDDPRLLLTTSVGLELEF